MAAVGAVVLAAAVCVGVVTGLAGAARGLSSITEIGFIHLKQLDGVLAGWRLNSMVRYPARRRDSLGLSR